MTRTPVTDDDWGDATHYSSGQPVEPRMFTEADPMSSFTGIWAIPVDEPVWGATTYVGRPRDRSGRRHRDDSAEPASPASTTGHQPAHAAQPKPGAGDTAATACQDQASDKGLMSNSRSMAIASLASRVTGFLRSSLLVAALGTGAVGDAYNSGNNLPNMIYELLLGGVLSSVLIPLLVKAEAEDDDGGTAYTQRLLSIATAALVVITALAVALSPWIAAAFVPAGPQRGLAAVFAALLLPEIFFYGLGAMFMAVLNIKHVYGPGAWAPLLNNVILIVTVAVFWVMPGPTSLNPSTMTTPQILVIGIGTSLGIAAQAMVLFPFLRRTGFKWAWRFRARPGENDRLKELGTLGGWVLAYVVVSQIGVSVIQKVGVAAGGFTTFTNVDLLFQMPYGVLVVSLLTAIMPRLSRAAVRGDTRAVVEDLSLGARLSAVGLIPITGGLIALGPVMGVTLFGFGSASVANGRLIGTSLAWSAFGLFPFALVMLQLRVFYAMRDGRTPALINVFMVGVKVALVIASSEIFKAPAGTNVHKNPSVHAVEWLNISTSLSYVVGAIVGHVLLTRRLGHLGFSRVLRTVVQIALASAVGAAVAWGVVELSRSALGSAHTGSAVGLIAGGVVGLGLMGAIMWRARIPDVREVVALARR